jgi:hypothetical protein
VSPLLLHREVTPRRTANDWRIKDDMLAVLGASIPVGSICGGGQLLMLYSKFI